MDWIVFASYPYVEALTPNVTYNVTYLELSPLGLIRIKVIRVGP